MSFISDYISDKNKNNEKILSVFLTAGFPDKNNFPELAVKVLEAGADMLEIGFPFSDPLADGPVIQHSSQKALEDGINLHTVFSYVKEIRKASNKPLILMGYANPVLTYGVKHFADDCKSAGVNGVIIPDVPIEEYDSFFSSSNSSANNYFEGLDKILLVTPTTLNKRIRLIDEKSSGFVYCVSVSGTTGIRDHHKTGGIDFVKRSQSVIKKNKILVGFGIATGEDAKAFTPYCDGVIVGSAVIKSLMNDDNSYSITLALVKELKQALKQ